MKEGQRDVFKAKQREVDAAILRAVRWHLKPGIIITSPPHQYLTRMDQHGRWNCLKKGPHFGWLLKLRY